MVFIGSLLSYKNVSFSLKVLFELKKIRSDFKFNVIGRGAYKKALERQVKKLGLNNNVEFLGAISDKEKLYQTIARCDLCLFTSVFDNDSLAILECASLNVPTLAVKGTGSAERIIDNENGFIEEQSDVKFAQKINQIMNDKDLIKRVGLSAKTIISPWEDAAIKYLDIYEQEINKKQAKH